MDAYLFTFKLAGKGLCSRHDTLDVISDARPERQVKCPGLSSTVKPSHDLIPTEQAKLLLELELR